MKHIYTIFIVIIFFHVFLVLAVESSTIYPVLILILILFLILSVHVQIEGLSVNVLCFLMTHPKQSFIPDREYDLSSTQIHQSILELIFQILFFYITF